MTKDVRGSELEFLRALRSRVAEKGNIQRGAVALGIGDDCAILRPGAGDEVLVTTDFSLEGRHFRRDWHAGESAGHRCLTRGLSDLAAMGAKPMAAFLSLAVPASMSSGRGALWLRSFMDGLLALATETGVPLAGGDTAAAPGEAMLADIVLLGSAPRGRSLRRSGAHAGDALYVTGWLGGAAAELRLLEQRPSRFRKVIAGDASGHPHLFPSDRLTVGEVLRRRSLATAAIDVSDGLSSDLMHLCEESRVDAVVEAAALPIHPLARTMGDKEALRLALHGGEEYELLFTAAAEARVPRSIAGVAITRIGTMVASRRKTKREMMLVGANGRRAVLHAAGWEHRF